jgi:glycosyltransferase involved in cell wall biosynthesis
MAPLVSFIVPTMNSGAVIGSALASLAAQTLREFEVIVSDGNSTDATVAVAREFEGRLPALCVDSRSDRGVYDAINRGVVLARGEWFLVLGSDDTLHAASTLATVAPALAAAPPTVQVVYGDVRMVAANSCGVAPGGRFAGPMPLKRLFKANVCQQAVFYRRSLFDRLGGFDERYQLYADWAFNIRAGFVGGSQWLDVVVADYACTGMSASASDPRFLEERPELIRRELRAAAGRRDCWPLQRQLLSDANRLLRRGAWWPAFRLALAYLQLLILRLPGLSGRF